LTRLSDKTSGISNLYVLLVYRPGRRKRIAIRRVSRQPFAPMTVGEELRIARKHVRVHAIEQHIEHRGTTLVHVAKVFTRAVAQKRDQAMLSNVVRMPPADDSVVAEFLRFHVLVRVYDGDPDAWLAQLRERGDDGGDVRFVRWIRSRLRQNPALLAEIRRMVDATPFWRAAEA
jgi:hypothetical protein